MSPKKLSEIRVAEYAVFRAEVALAVEPKLHILLVHLYVEHLLERYLNASLKRTDRLFGKNGLSFEKKFLLIEAMGGLTAQHIDSVRKLNTIRNDCAHKFKYQFTAGELDDFGRTLGKTYAGILKKHPVNLANRMRSVCEHLSGALLRAVVELEHKDA